MAFKGQKRHKKLKIPIAELPELPDGKIKTNHQQGLAEQPGLQNPNESGH
jgi:hypothetical protein